MLYIKEYLENAKLKTVNVQDIMKELIEPEIEKEIDEEIESEIEESEIQKTEVVNLDLDEYEKIKANPYDYIVTFYEELYKHLGKRVMEVLSLVLCSLVLPRFVDYNGKENIVRISYLLLSPPGTGKTTISNHFSYLALNPFPFEYITDAKLADVLRKTDKVSIITSDIARIFRDPFLSKLVENVIGDEGKLSRFTKRSKDIEEKKLDAIAYFAGTPANLNTTISDGIIFRVHPTIIFHSELEHEEILKKQNSMINNSNGSKIIDKEKVIKKYYEELYEMQRDNKINGYIIPEYFREEVQNKLIPLFVKSHQSTDFEFIRELNQCYKYMVCHAFLNVYSRKISDGKLVLEDKDLRVAINLSEKEIRTKTAILKCINIISERRLRTLKDLDDYAREYKNATKKDFPDLYYKILQTIIRNR